jgi:hypothetical protein
MKKIPTNGAPQGVNIEPNPYVVHRLLEVLAAQHGVAVEVAVRESLDGTKATDAQIDERAMAAGAAAYSAYWKALKVIVAELTPEIDTSDVEAIAAQAKKEGSK